VISAVPFSRGLFENRALQKMFVYASAVQDVPEV
jgi:hypothetical protein